MDVMDHSTEILPGTCFLCNKKFADRKLRNRHIKRVHKIAVSLSRKNNILCPFCKEENDEINTYQSLRNHIEKNHEITIEKINFEFSSTHEYELWKNTEKIETMYAVDRNNQYKDHKEVHYVCNRNSTRGYQAKQFKRTEKAGGTIKIHGVCPSKLIVKIYSTGKSIVTFWKTHAGHDEKELRSKHLSTTEKNTVIEKLKCGVSKARILEDARKLEKSELERINLLSSNDVNYLARKHNIEKKRDNNDMVAVALKVEEWNANGKNFAFFFKQEGETHNVLKKEDFALGFMNSVMEEKLRKFQTIICMDGTHGTNRKGMDLTIMLIKDDKNAGFPVAFFLSNRLDQQVQEVFLDALKKKIQQEIVPEYFMSDDDPKYYNAWVKTMANKPRRLLCTWHVVKNWNIQGKKKIKDADLKKQMKYEMKRILNETNEQRFLQVTNTYLEKLQKSNEVDFVNYLLKYYYQDQERIQMWAHCYRKNSGINTNMAIETLNNLLKTNQLKRRTNVTVEKLLDTIEDLVDIKMWRRILDMKRPNANNYQDRIIIKAHKKAESMKDKVKVFEQVEVFGEFKVKSFKSENFYNIKLKKVCESECRTLYCRVCKICIHRYQCDCPEYAVKNTMCKHVHLVRMHDIERMGTNSVVDDFAEALGACSQIKTQQKEEITQFIDEKMTHQELDQVREDPNKRISIHREELHKWLNNLNNEAFERFVKNIQGARKQENEIAKKEIRVTKRKMEKQEYFPINKRRKE